MKYLTIPFIFIISTLSLYSNNKIQWFTKKINQIQSLKTIKADIEQKIVSNDKGSEIFKGRYRADSYGNIRIDYFFPKKMIVFCNSKGIYWFYPQNKIVYYSSSVSKKSMIPNKLNIILPGDRYKIIYFGKDKIDLFTSVKVFKIRDIINKSSLFYYLDFQTGIVLQKRVVDSENRELIKEIYGKYKKIKSIDIPHQVDVRVRTENGIVKNITEYKNIIVNGNINKRIFQINFPSDVEWRKFDE